MVRYPSRVEHRKSHLLRQVSSSFRFAVSGENSGGALFKADNFLSPSLIKQKTLIERIGLRVSGYALRSTRSSIRELSCLFAAGGDHFPGLTEFFNSLM
jgi:hypothetical protein